MKKVFFNHALIILEVFLFNDHLVYFKRRV